MPMGPDQGLGFWSMLTDPRTRAVGRAEAVAGLGGQQSIPQTPGMPPEPQAPTMVPPLPQVDIQGAFDAGTSAAEGRAGFARGGRVRGYAIGGPVSADRGDYDPEDEEDDGEMPMAGLGSVSPILLQLAKHMMPGRGGDAPISGEDKGLALANAGFAMAAGNSPNALQNFGAGAGAGIESLMKLRQQRALQRMREQIADQQLIGRLATMRPPTAPRPIKVGNDLVDPVTHEVVYKGSPTADTEYGKTLVAAGIMPGTPEYVKRINEHMALSERKDRAAVAASESLAAARGDKDLPEGTGDAFLAQLPEKDQGIVKQLVEGRILPQTISTRNGERAYLLRAASQFDPTFDVANSAARFQTKKNFTSGVEARNITSADTLVGHINTMMDKAAKLDNTKIRKYNTVGNYLATETGAPEVKSFNIARDAVAKELTRLFRGTGGTLEEVKQFQSDINGSDSPEQLKAVTMTALELMDSRLEGLANQYNRGMGTDKHGRDLISPHAREILEKMDEGFVGTQPPDVAAPKDPRESLLDKYAPRP